VGETMTLLSDEASRVSFSILERIDVGETHGQPGIACAPSTTFSILERIDVGETSSEDD